MRAVYVASVIDEPVFARRYRWLAPVVLVFGVLMASSIAALTAYAGNVPLTIAMGALALASLVFSALVIRSLR